MAGPSQRRILAALLVVQVAFGGLSVAGKLVLPHVPALALAQCRLVAAALVLVALERILVRAPIPPPRDLARFALFALLGVVLNQALFLSGLALTTATHAVLLVATIPALTLLVAVLLRHEKAGPLKVAGLALSFGGVAVLVLGKGIAGGSLLGDALVLLNALSYSVYLVLSRPVLDRYDPLTLIAWVFAWGALMLLPFAWGQLAAVSWSALGASAWWGFAYALVVGTVLSYGLNNWALRHSSASHVASFVYLQPVVGAIAAWAILDEVPGAATVAAAALILAGVYLANKASPGRRAANPAE